MHDFEVGGKEGWQRQRRLPADNESMCIGYNNDNYRRIAMVPQLDRNGALLWQRSGSTRHIAFCDRYVKEDTKPSSARKS